MSANYASEPSGVLSRFSVLRRTRRFAYTITTTVAFDPNTLHPPAPSPLFTGRAQELKYIDSFFRSGSGDELIIRGVSGCGKTQLALKYAQMRTLHRNVLYVNSTSVTHVLPEILSQINPSQFEATLDAMVERRDYPARPGIAARQSYANDLVIFDGLTPQDLCGHEYYRAFRRYMLTMLGCQRLSILYLVDSQTTGVFSWQHQYELPYGLDAEAASSLLIKSVCLQYEDLSPEDKETAGDMVEHFGGFPPTVLQIGGVIQNTGFTLQGYRDMSDEQRHEWLARVGTSSDALWRSFYEMLSDSAQTLLEILAFLPLQDPDLLEKMLIRARSNLDGYQSLLLEKGDMERIEKVTKMILLQFASEATWCEPDDDSAISDLKSQFVLSPEGRGLGLRSNAFTWAKTLVNDQLFGEASAVYLLAVSIGSQSESGNICRAFRLKLEPLVEEVLLRYPDACAHYYHEFSLVYEARNRWRDAAKLQDLLLRQCKLKLGQHHVNTSLATTCLVRTYCKLGRWKDAKKLQSALLSHQQDALGQTHLNVLSTTHDLALMLSRLGRWEDAESLQEHVCDGRKQALGATHPDTLSAMHCLASIYFEQGRWQEASELHENVLRTRRRVLGEQHADTLSSLHSLATKHWEAGQSTQDAEELNIRVLEARKKVLGLEHPDTLSSLIALAMVYRRQGQWRIATDLVAEVLTTQRELLGRDHIDTIQTMRSLASWYSEHGPLSNAVNLRAEILESRRAVYGNDSPETLASMDELVLTYWKQGIWVQAETLHLELLEARKRALGDDDPSCLATSLDLATRYLSQCRWREASLLLKKVLGIKRKDQELEEDDPETADIQKQLDLTIFALSLDVFIISPAVPMESVVAHFTGRAGLRDYSSQLQEVPDLPTAPIAWGGFSNIYRIKVRGGSELAVKCLKDSQGEYKQVKQTIRELSTWSQLRSESIAPLLGLAVFKNQLAMVSLWNKRGNVMKHMEEEPDLDRYALCTQVAKAVVYLHKSDVIHGDLKGANILVSDDGTLQLTDFGLTIMHDAMIQFSKSENKVGGTLRWMAPEIVFGGGADGGLTEQSNRSLSETLTRVREDKGDSEAKLCKETDIYALGMTMLELLTGKPPFREFEKDAAVILALGQGKRPRRPKKVLDQSPRGAPFWDILQKCWAEKPADRPTANEVETSMLQLGTD